MGDEFWVAKSHGIARIPENKNIAIRMHDVKLSDAPSPSFVTQQKLHLSYESLTEYLDANPLENTSIRAIHICQLNSYSELLLNSQCFNELTTRHGIMPDFSSISSHFTARRMATETAFCGPILQSNTADKLELSYILKYPELKKAADESSWAIRQVGVYQQYCKTSKRSIWVFLHCMQQSAGQRLITELLNTNSGSRAAHCRPAVMHLLLMSAYLYNWQNYMAFYEKELLTRFNGAIGARLEDIPSTSYDTITRVRFLEDKLAPLPSIFSSLLSMITTLQTQFPELSPSSYSTPYSSQLASYGSLIRACESNVGYLLHQCNALSQFIVESSSHTQNGLMVSDSASIKVITILTLIYLPASFIATFFGMQFFGSSLTLPKLWIFFVAAVVLTLLTICGWLWQAERAKRRRNLEAKKERDVENC